MKPFTEISYKDQVALMKKVRKKLAKVSVGLPLSVHFNFKEGKVICYPKLKKWVVTPKGKKSIIHIKNGRNDVTKYRAKRLLKLAIINMLRED